MRRLLLLALLLSIVSSVARAEIHRCSVGYQKALSNRPDELIIRTNSGVDIGSFDVTIAKDAVVSKVYRLSGTNLFVVANVSYEDHILGSEDIQTT